MSSLGGGADVMDAADADADLPLAAESNMGGASFEPMGDGVGVAPIAVGVAIGVGVKPVGWSRKYFTSTSK